MRRYFSYRQELSDFAIAEQFPTFLREGFFYVRSLFYEDEPDYEYLLSLFESKQKTKSSNWSSMKSRLSCDSTPKQHSRSEMVLEESKLFLNPTDLVQNQPSAGGDSASLFGGTISSLCSQQQVLQEEEEKQETSEEGSCGVPFDELAGIDDECVQNKVELHQLDSHSGKDIFRRNSIKTGVHTP